jgi:Fic family protein
MNRTDTGYYVTISTVGEKCKAFIPHPLPPKPPLEISDKLQNIIDQALLTLGRLDSISMLIPDVNIFLYMYVRKEAVLSSQIEGTQSSLSDLLISEITEVPGIPVDDIKEVSNYVAALSHGLKRIRDGFPLSSRLIRELHEILLSSGRGEKKNPGEFRHSQNWIGGTRPGNASFVPPPPDQISICMGELEKFIHNQKQNIPVLIKTALLHAQFETIHPFLDGNGRIGRLLIPLFLCTEKVLKEPMLYLALYFKKHRQLYYKHLQNVRKTGDWETWITFFMKAIQETAEQAVQTTTTLRKIIENDRSKIQKIKRISGSALQVHHALLERPILSIPLACKITGLYPTTITAVMKQLENQKIVREITGRKRNRLYSYDRYIQILNKDTEITK